MSAQFLEEIFQHQALVHRICRMYRNSKEDREDLFQEIIYQLWKAYPQFQGRSKISTWIYKIGLNTALASFRKPTIKAYPISEHKDQAGLAAEKPEEEQREKLFWAIKQLNEADRALIALYLEGFNYKEMAEIIGIKENYIGVRLNRIKEKIKKLLNL